MHKILSYCKSHIYDIHAIIAGTLIFIIIQLIKGKIKGSIRSYIDAKFFEKTKAYRVNYSKRAFAVIYPIIFIMAFLFYWILAMISPFIHFSVTSAILSATIAITEFEIYDKIR